MPFRRHVNGLEFCYRTLVECCGFKHENVFVLNYDRSLRHVTDDGVGVAPEPGNWPGDSTPYRIAVTHEGSRRAFRNVIGLLADRLKPDDQLFIHTTGHGGHHGDGRGPHLAVYPHWEDYRVGDFCSDLSQLPPHRSLLV